MVGDGLSCVFRLQRWFSLALGAALLMFPEWLFRTIGVTTPLIAPFKLALQSWACFILALSMIVHCAIDVPPEARRSIGYCLLIAFGMLTSIYGDCLYENGLSPGSTWKDDLVEYRIPIAAAGSCFALLFLCYGFVLGCSKGPRPRRLSDRTHNNGNGYKTITVWEELDYNPYLGE
eukprot:g34220.t1